MYPTVTEVLSLDVVRRGAPKVVAGAEFLNRPVRWVHVSELADIADLLRGGELVLTTGIALPSAAGGLRRYIDRLADVGIAGLVVELGRRYDKALPSTLVSAANKRSLPLVVLRREVPFVHVTEAVHALIVNAQLVELRASDEIHQTFTELSVEGAPLNAVLSQVAKMSGCAVVLENLVHHVLAYEIPALTANVALDGWEERSRTVTTSERTAWVERAGWLVTSVGARGENWGRLILLCDEAPPARSFVLLERAAGALALRRLLEREQETLERQSHRSLLAAILNHSQSEAELGVRARALGVPLEGRRLVGMAFRARSDDEQAGPVNTHKAAAELAAVWAVQATELETQAEPREIGEVVARACRDARIPALTGGLDQQSVGLLLSLDPTAPVDDMVDNLATTVRQLGENRRLARIIVAAGSSVTFPQGARRSLVEAQQVADAAVRDDNGSAVRRLSDVGVRGLVHLLRDDARLQTYVERQIGLLLAYDATHDADLLRTLRAYLATGRNKSAAASASQLSRPALYDRLAQVEHILGIDLGSPDTCLSLHVALLGLDALRQDAT